MRLRSVVGLLLSISATLVCRAGVCADDVRDASPLTLADVAQYQRALAGKATADSAKPGDPVITVTFTDLWERTDAMRGRRVNVLGRVQRIFRQGPVGGFPPLAEVWICSPAADPFCLVYAHRNTPDKVVENGQHGAGIKESNAIPSPGNVVQFTGTFLKLVRYTAGDGARLAPLIVGEHPPFAASESESTAGKRGFTGKRATGASRSAASPGHRNCPPETYAVGLVLIGLVIGVLILQHRRLAPQCLVRDSRIANTGGVAELPLEFIDDRHEPSKSGTL